MDNRNIKEMYCSRFKELCDDCKYNTAAWDRTWFYIMTGVDLELLTFSEADKCFDELKCAKAYYWEHYD